MFKQIPRIEIDEIVDKAFKNARKKALSSKKNINEIVKEKESIRVTVAGENLTESLFKVVDRYPSFDRLPPFTRELIDIIVGIDKLRHNLGAVSFAINTINSIKIEYIKNIRRTKSPQDASYLRKECYGRYISILKQIEKNLKYLNDARDKLKNLPSINPDLYTVVIAGFPNVGKSSLLKALTNSEPEINSYPFTTKGINISSFKYNNKTIQVVDTPGLLDRELSYRNHIELQAISALKYLAKLILFVFDPTESCGYSMQKQMSLYNEISEQFIGIPFIKILNKSDLKEWGFKEDIEGIKISAEEGENIDLLKENIEEILFNYFEEEVDYFEKD
ncbi:MAG: tRNA modification GTPase TrmE [Candidatus Methanofastidiosum methylothiophilum]|jgi:nucleolar GTP-binding protein|uniref:tRNA modification GTPase TrmE n=1 Tax=Candidatus Methanofastidiosum methylothiophilum TaxID=1705564 RepID=A0A150JJM0_9EURY|nr:MAG: tRNA modification GTPase TrmE [Candidatus Methanofastidiosum methylthiophilus]MBP6932201.1 50S ribosome-binding GTPase [Methanofastidiosum sp.]OQC52581.1 MAG: tRNA modification GTPase TrmE [Euryarchaeota archaeon ADurb.Bin023]KYC57371.1 MAG: tRNA modification GTPase TrmE [Candidatus Methanofastidiosum methylthiophilus]KYC58157.1 MAG: tRNA modification GTPase TrmE [Candidatus Methanofastidiosum methylthiophilus]